MPDAGDQDRAGQESGKQSPRQDETGRADPSEDILRCHVN